MGNDTPDLRPPGRGAAWKWWVCGILLLATMLNYMDRQTLNLMAKRIIDEFQLTTFEYGLLEKYFGWAFALGAIVFGWVVDRGNIRWIYPAVVLAWSAAGFATGLVNGFLGLVMCRFLLGLAEGGHWPCALRTTQHILPASERSMGNSLLQSGAAFGAILTPLIVMGTLAWAGSLPGSQVSAWRYPFWIIGIIGIGWIFLWLGSVRREDLDMARAPSPVSQLSVLLVLLPLLLVDVLVHVFAHDRIVLLSTSVVVTVVAVSWVFGWLLYITRQDDRLPRRLFIQRYIALMVLVTTINITWHYFRAWLPLFLQTAHGYNEQDTNRFIMAYYIIADVGTIAAGFVTLRLTRVGLPVHWSRVVVFSVCAALCTLSVVVAFLPAGPLLLGLLMLIGFAALGLFPNYYSFSQEITVQYQGKVTGSLGCINWLMMALLHELAGDSIKQTQSYAEGLGVAGLAPLLGLAALLLLWGKYEPTAPAPELPEEKPSAPPAPADEAIQAASDDRVRPAVS
ncbi:MAG: MFS transporter [Planctomycetia bacterium]|nr:MFS transporter [Planctomycetia bacterium]